MQQTLGSLASTTDLSPVPNCRQYWTRPREGARNDKTVLQLSALL